MILDVSCATCRWSVPTIGDDDIPRYDCYRYPPQFVYVGVNEDIATIRPQVEGDDYCGEWQGDET